MSASGPWLCLAGGLVLLPATARAELWRNVSETALGTQTAGWTNKTDLADVDGDGRVDILFANGSAYNEPGVPEPNGVWINVGNDDSGVPRFEDRSAEVFGEQGDFTRVIKGRDVTGDGIVDIIVGNTYETQSRLFVGLGEGRFEERTDLLPAMNASIGDLEVGDIDGDGDLDLVLADWGLDDPSGGPMLDPFTAPGGQMLVWLNELDGEAGRFVDATPERMPADVLVAWSWEMELIDVDADFDLDVVASCKSCSGSSLFLNEGGRFQHAPNGLPAFANNYDFEPMFLDVPGRDRATLAVVTINDGDQVDDFNQFDKQEHLFLAGDGGRFEDATATLWPDEHNAGRDDNMVVVLDFDSDEDPDFLIGALGPEDDRLHVNRLNEDGTFHLDANDGIATGLSGTPGTLGIALADLNGDGKLDLVQSQGELADPEHVWIGDEIAPDTAAPQFVGLSSPRATEDGVAIVARLHDNKSPSRPHDWRHVELRWSVDGQDQPALGLRWVGEFMWRAEVPASEGMLSYRVCASDAAGNEACSDALEVELDEKEDDVGDEQDDGASAAGCRMGGEASPAAGLLLLLVAGLRVRRGR